MKLYEVFSEGYHTPLSREQIAELFYAGRLGRDDLCKQVEKTEWRTIDELFPLLKHDPLAYSIPVGGKTDRSISNESLVVAASILATIAIALTAYLMYGRSPAIEPISSAIAHKRVISTATSDAPFPASNTVVTRQPATVQAEQTQRERLDQGRLSYEQQEREKQKAAGTNIVAPLDQFTVIYNVGGSNVRVKIHDNDVTSFDVCVNGNWRHEVTKQKGTSGSRTDETLIYQTGKAQLYYVWEISGHLNHCLLRVRND